jgi:hypothetical protein
MAATARILRSQREVGPARRGQIDEERDGWHPGQFLEWEKAIRWRQWQGQEGELVLATNVQCRPAGGQDGQARTGRKESSDLGGDSEDLLTVVEQEEELL